jgi:Nucleotidyltransferase of unknown function (DUF6036)
MQRLDRNQIVRFLHALDDCLEKDLTVCVIGGMAAVLGYHANVKTADMDAFAITSGTFNDLMQAARLATKFTGINLLIDRASIANLPDNYEDRVRFVRGVRFRKLTIKVPDKYDLVLSKAVRSYDHDLEAIHSIHDNHPLSEKTLVARYETELRETIAMTNVRNLDINIASLMDELFGKERAEFYRARWGLIP